MHAGATRTWLVVSVIIVALMHWACDRQTVGASTDTSETSDSTATQPARAGGSEKFNVADVSREIAAGVGEVRETASQGAKGALFAFEEFHTSRVGQLQIAVMLLRLHERYGLRTIGLEGHLQSPEPLDATWFHSAGGKSAEGAREDVALRLLSEGEISAAEFMAMVFGDVEVHGLEREEEYGHTLDVEGNPQVIVLLGIAEKKLTQSDIRKVNTLIEQEKQEEAVEYIMNADSWVRQQYEALKEPAVSVEAMARGIREIRDKARDLGVQIEPIVKRELEQSLRFMEVASKRSATMIDHMLKLCERESAAPSAMVMGAGHSDRVIQLLQERNVSFAIPTPKALNPENANLSMEQFKRKGNREWARTALGTLGRLLNGQRKPPPFISTVTGKSGASAYLAAKLIAEAAREGRRIPDDIHGQMASLPEFRLDRGSFRVDGYDVIYRAYMKQTDGKEREGWFRVGTADSGETSKTLEAKLLQRIIDLGGEGDVPARRPPPESEATGDKQGPGDGERIVVIKGKEAKIVISRLGWRALMVVAENQSTVNNIGRLSG